MCLSALNESVEGTVEFHVQSKSVASFKISDLTSVSPAVNCIMILTNREFSSEI